MPSTHNVIYNSADVSGGKPNVNAAPVTVLASSQLAIDASLAGKWVFGLSNVPVQIGPVVSSTVAPGTSGTLSNVTVARGTAGSTRPTAQAFTGTDLTYTVSGGFALIDTATGVVTHVTSSAQTATLITVTASNNLGSVSLSYNLTVTEAPTLISPFQDQQFDLNSGSKSVPIAPHFSGRLLTFAVSGGGATISGGSVVIPTTTALDQVPITVTASGPDGPNVSDIFLVDVASGVVAPTSYKLGAVTPANTRIMPLAGTITAGNGLGYFGRDVNGFLFVTPAGVGNLSGTYTLTAGGQTYTLNVQQNQTSCYALDIQTAEPTTSTATSRGLLVHGNIDCSSLGRIVIAPRTMANRYTIQPAQWTENSNTKLSVRGALYAGLDFGIGAALIDNVQIQGFRIRKNKGSELEAEGVVKVGRPSQHCIVRQMEIASRSMVEIYDSNADPALNDFRNNLSTMNSQRGLSTGNGSGQNLGLVVEDNWIHDVTRGISSTGDSAYNGQNSRYSRNVIEDFYTNGSTFGFCNGLDIFDNIQYGAWAESQDTLTFSTIASRPHASVGLSFDTGGYGSTQNVNILGNRSYVGRNRALLVEARAASFPTAGHVSGTNAATGMKLNDPSTLGSYLNILIAFNHIDATGLSIEVSGGLNIDIFHNTVTAAYGVGGTASIMLNKCQNVRVAGNASTLYTFGGNDNSTLGDFPSDWATVDHTIGYNNAVLGSRNTAIVGMPSAFVGDPVKGFTNLNLEEILAAYEPKPGGPLFDADGVVQGATGNPLYQGNGVHSFVFDPIQSTGPTYEPTRTIWDTDVVNTWRSDGFNVLDQNEFTWAIDIEFSPVSDRTHRNILGAQFANFDLFRESNGYVSLIGKKSNNIVFNQTSSFQLDSSDGRVYLAGSFDMVTGRCHMIKSDVGEAMPKGGVKAAGPISLGSSNGIRFGNNHNNTAGRHFNGTIGQILLACEYVDLDTQAGRDRIFSASGFADWGSGGLLAFPGRGAEFVIRGTAGNIVNGGFGGPVTTGNGLQNFTGQVNPTLTNPDVVPTGETTATATVSTNVNTGPLHYRLRPAVDPIATTTQMSAAPSQAVTAAGVQSIPLTGLTTGTQYRVDFMHANGTANSAIVPSPTFATELPPPPAAPTTFTRVWQNGSNAIGVGYLPELAAGQFLVHMTFAAQGGSGDLGPFVTPAGWTSLRQGIHSSGARKVHIMAKIATGTETGTVSGITSSVTAALSCMMAFDFDVDLTGFAAEGSGSSSIGVTGATSGGLPAGATTGTIFPVVFYGLLGKTSALPPVATTGMLITNEVRMVIDASDDARGGTLLIPSGAARSDIAITALGVLGNYMLNGGIMIRLNP